MSDNTVHGSGCNYPNLSNYNMKSAGTLGTPAVPPTTVSGSYIVPNYGAIGYNALTHNMAMPSCSGYFNICNAYGGCDQQGAFNCKTSFSSSPCNQ